MYFNTILEDIMILFLMLSIPIGQITPKLDI